MPITDYFLLNTECSVRAESRWENHWRTQVGIEPTTPIAGQASNQLTFHKFGVQSVFSARKSLKLTCILFMFDFEQESYEINAV